MKHLPPDAIAFEPEDLPELLRTLREQTLMSQMEVSHAMGHEHQAAYEQYEAGRTVPSIKQLCHILEALGYRAAFFAVKPPMTGEKLLRAVAGATQIMASTVKAQKTILRKTL